MRTSARISLLLFAAALFAGCGQERADSDSQAGDLFRKSVEVARRYISKMKAMPDSLSADSLDRLYTEELAKLNMNYPPETDRELSQGQNDTLFQLSKTYTLLLRRKLNPPAEPDSVAEAQPESSTKAQTEES